MQNALRSDYDESLRDFFRIVRLKTRYVPDKVLLRCVRQLNLKRRHCIKRTASSDKFLNIATEEIIAASNRQVLTYVTVLFGDFIPGSFRETSLGKTHIAGRILKNGPIIALKRSVYNGDHGVSKTYTLIIYDPVA